MTSHLASRRKTSNWKLIFDSNKTPTRLTFLISSSLKANLIDSEYLIETFEFFILAAESSLRDKYHKCFSCDLRKIENKISKIRVKLEVKVVYDVTMILD